MKESIIAIGEILFDFNQKNKHLGGAPFNFFYHIFNITGRGYFVSRIGNDKLGLEIKHFFKEHNINDKFLQIDTQHKTGRAFANLDKNGVPHWVIEDNSAFDFIENRSDLMNLIEGETQCLYFGTLCQRNNISRETIQSLFFREIQYFCDLNLRQNYYSKEIIDIALKTSNILKINEDELHNINNLFFNGVVKDEKNMAIQLINNYSIDLICITKGAKGASLYTSDDESHYQSKVDEIVDTIGAGDAFASVLCLGFLKGLSLHKLNKISNNFAAQICTIEGAIPMKKNFYNNIIEEFNNG